MAFFLHSCSIVIVDDLDFFLKNFPQFNPVQLISSQISKLIVV